MRDLLTGLAILVIVALATALVGPYFVDWTAQRPRIEERLTQAFGLPVTVAGPIEVRLLPSPHLDLQTVSVGQAGRGLTLSADRVLAEISVMPLLRGDIRVVEATLDRPLLEATVTPDGAIQGQDAMAQASDGLRAAAIERLVLRDGTVRVRDAASGRVSALEDIDGEADAQALLGPWRANLRARIGDNPVDLRLATGAPEEQGTRVKLVLQAINGHQRGEADGRIQFDAAGVAAFDGRLLAGGRLRWPDKDGFALRPWTLGANLKLRNRTGDLSQAEIEAGGDEIPVKLSGSGQLDLQGEPRLALTLEAKQIDLDKPFTLQGRTAPAPAEVLGAWINAFGMDDAGASPPLRVAVGVKVGSLLVGGDVVSGARASLALGGPGLTIEQFQAALPGSSDLQLAGQAAFGQGGRLDGRIRVTSKDASRLLGWAEAERSGRSNRLGDAKDMAAEADVSLSSAVMAARGLKLRVERSTLQGTVRFTPPEATTRGRFEAQLTSDGLAIEQAPDVSTLAAAAQGVDVAITLNARNVRVGQARGPTVGAGRLSVKLSVGAEGVSIDMLDIADVGGASVTASGQVGEKGGRLDATVDARRVEPLAELLKKVAPGRFPGLLATRAAALSPLKLKISATRAAGVAGATEINLDGTAAGSRLAGAATLGGGQSADRVTMSFKLDATESAPFLRQLGFEALPLSGFGPGRLAVDVDGRFGGGATLRLSGSAAGSTLAGEGRIGQTTADPDVSGAFTLSAADAAPLMQLLALPGPDSLSRAPLQAKASVTIAEAKWALSDLNGQFGGQPFSGKLGLDLEKATLDGSLAFERLALAGVAGLSLGPSQPPIAGALWSSSRFGPVLPPPFATQLAISAKALDLGQGWTADDARFALRWTPDLLEVSQAQASFMGGSVGGGFQLRRQGGLANASGKISLAGVSLPALLPDAGMAGALDGEIDGAAAGETPSALVAALSGGGRTRIRSLIIPRFDPAALPAVAASLDAQSEVGDVQKVAAALRTALDRAGLQVPQLDLPVTLSNGVARLGPASIQGATSAQGSAMLDLRTARFDGRAALSAEPPPGWSGPAPQAGLSWRKNRTGPAERELDVSLLTNTLTTHAVARELEKVEAAEADLRERSFFVRRLKAERDRLERERQEAEAARAAEEARIAEEARKAEEARIAAETRRLEEQRAAERKAREEQALREQAARDQAEREQAARDAAAEAARREAARIEAARTEAVRLDAERQRVEAERAARAQAAREAAPATKDDSGAAEAARIMGQATPDLRVPQSPGKPAFTEPGQPSAP
ncbi:hypothetical protein GCM10007036_35790 [Alsobacter metallidurans]|uniref:AsmA domain-containing protein n=1 Tax=Alsobacter metallidurans TaxID=340221 RepID=A0A917I9E8_9HYPH|nr:AsmA-like C-terminal region-containing protein [Alsobacter metallidurans]GGH27346.1 hypothetical protein GCM10007036_35790 [Alsobacter metallidurans]